MSGCFARILQICLTLLGLLVVVFVLRFWSGNRAADLPTQTAAPRAIVTSVAPPLNDASAIANGATAVPVALVIPEDMFPTVGAICEQAENLTALQREGLAAAVIGHKISGWVGTISRIRQDEEDEAMYRVLVAMRADDVAVWQVELRGIPQELANTLQVEQSIQVAGTIQQVGIAPAGLCRPLVINEAAITTDFE